MLVWLYGLAVKWLLMGDIPEAHNYAIDGVAADLGLERRLVEETYWRIPLIIRGVVTSTRIWQ